MLFQWYLFVFLIFLFLTSRIGSQTYQIYAAGEYEWRCKWLTAFSVIAVLTLVAANRSFTFIDTTSYYSHYMREPGTWESFFQYLTGSGKDPAFYALTALLKKLLGHRVRLYFGLISGICLLLVFSVFRRHSSNFYITTFLFIASGEYVQWTHNGMRQFIAVSIVFAATDLLLQRRYILYTLLVLLASTFHGSALIMLPAVLVLQGRPWNRKTILTVMVTLILASSTGLLNELLLLVMENSQYANDVHALMSTGGTNVIRVLVFAIPPILALRFREQITLLDLPGISLSVNMSILSLCIYIISMFTSGIYIGRLPIYFSLHNYLLLPWIIERFFEKNTAKVIYVLLIACYMIFYYYQMHIVWGGVISQ